ncbi:MAG: alpha/beta hydrolase [Pseudomonadota bacterium]
MWWGIGMPLCQVNIAGGALQARGCVTSTLRRAMACLADGAPVIVLVHGYKYSPFAEENNPHDLIFALDPKRHWKAVSWPRRLGFGGSGHDEDALCIALGWEARGSLWQAYGQAADAGKALADLVELIGRLRPNTQVQVMAHSLGGRVALSALPHLPEGGINRMVLLAAAELQRQAQVWLDCPAGRRVEVLNVRSRENGVFDRLLEWLIAPYARGERALGGGLGRPAENWIDLCVDEPRTRAALASLGFCVPAPDRRICHWSVYLRAGVFDVYRAVLTGMLSFADLRAALTHVPGRTRAPAPIAQPRWRDWLLPIPRRGAS